MWACIAREHVSDGRSVTGVRASERGRDVGGVCNSAASLRTRGVGWAGRWVTGPLSAIGRIKLQRGELWAARMTPVKAVGLRVSESCAACGTVYIV